ncbi:uncharacterized protein [Oscarella lobularis]|uniref:uncharacterized protein n=1 Tax=Oscarella lobularis TaxID=121494 RepID=UPI0033141C3E
MGSSFAKLAAIDFAIQGSGFLLANLFQTEKFYDLTGSLTFVVVALQSLLWAKRRATTRQKVQTALVCTWAARLGLFLFFRVLRVGKDSRFDKIKTNPWKFLVAWTLQGVWVLVTLAPSLILNSKSNDTPLQNRDYFGWILWTFGFLLESIADHQKNTFKMDPANKGKWINKGLWSISQHPNYLGEILLWIGHLIPATSVFDTPFDYISVGSPLFIAFLLIRVSGINMQDRQGLKRWGADAAYQEYIRSTAKLIPYIW